MMLLMITTQFVMEKPQHQNHFMISILNLVAGVSNRHYQKSHLAPSAIK